MDEKKTLYPAFSKNGVYTPKCLEVLTIDKSHPNLWKMGASIYIHNFSPRKF